MTGLLIDGLLAVNGSAQMTLAVQKYSGEAQQWVKSLVITAPQDLNFRWTVDGPVPHNLHWEIARSYDFPTSVTRAGVRMNYLSPPPAGQFAVFKIGKDALPVLAQGHAFWVRVVGSSPGEKAIGGSAAKIIASPSVQITYQPAAAPTSFATNDPLWVKLTKIICEAETNDASPSDEVYAVVASVFLNHADVPSSPVFVAGTRLYEGMDVGEVRPVEVPVWGPPSGSPVTIDKPENAIILAAIMENDGNETDNVLAIDSVFAHLGNYLKSLPKTGTPDAQILTALEGGMTAAMGGSTGGLLPFDADDPIGTTQLLTLTPLDLTKAQEGQIVKKSLVFATAGVAGRYRLRFQVGKKGLATVVW
jgi:hypothetical protein